MAVDIDDVLQRGGKPRVGVLPFAVSSVQPEPLFLFLVKEYRAATRSAVALALDDAFCATAAPARIDAAVLEPRDLRLPRTIDPIRRQTARAAEPLPVVPEGKQPTHEGFKRQFGRPSLNPLGGGLM